MSVVSVFPVPQRHSLPTPQKPATPHVNEGAAEFGDCIEYFMYNHQYPKPAPSRRWRNLRLVTEPPPTTRRGSSEDNGAPPAVMTDIAV